MAIKKDPEEESKQAAPVTFSAEQMEVINRMMTEVVQKNNPSNNPNNQISVYNLRDPRKIETIPVYRFDGKFVMGFKDYNTDPYIKAPRYYNLGIDLNRKLQNEPYVTLILSEAGEQPIEKEVMLITYMDNRTRQDFPVLSCEVRETVHNHGILGNSGANAIAVDSKGVPERRMNTLAQSKTEVRIFTVQLPGFPEPSEFILE